MLFQNRMTLFILFLLSKRDDMFVKVIIRIEFPLSHYPACPDNPESGSSEQVGR